MSPKSSSAALDSLYTLIGPDLIKTNQVIMQHLDSQVEMIPQLGTHLISSGGKRLRPILTLITARLFGYTGEEHALLGAVIEFIHTATLLHDDVVDRSATRRGKATANSVWGSKAPVLVGDFLFSRAFQLLVQHGDMRVLKTIADACAVISEGEVMQLVASNNLATTEEQYLEVITRKTATLFSAAARIGAILNHRPEEEEEQLARYGRMLGNAYQLVDDALDYAADQEVLGKTIGDDFQEGKVTLPIIHAYRHGSEEERSFWRLCIEEGNHPEGSLTRAIALLRQEGSLTYAFEQAKLHVEEAKQALAFLPPSPEKEALLLLADFAVSREF